MAGKRNIDVTDFALAPRREAIPSKQPEPLAAPLPASEPEMTSELAAEPVPARNMLAESPVKAKERTVAKALESEERRSRLARLKQNRQRESKHFINIPLDINLKRRLEQAAFDHDIKMAAVVRDALDEYLTNAGYP